MNIHYKKITGKTNQAGFSLVELMVGLVIGLFATLAIMQVFGVFEGQKRTTSGNADAQTNGSVALFNMQRDLKMAGYGLPMLDGDNMALNCTNTNLATTAVLPNPAIPIDINPVRIVNGAAGASDSVTVNYGTTDNGAIAVKVNAIAAGNQINIVNNMACNNNDIVIAIRGNTCLAQQITPATPAPRVNLTAAPHLRPDQSRITLRSLGVAPNNIQPGDSVSCLRSWNTVTYAVDANNMLTRNTIVNGVVVITPIVDGVVSIQAQYGISAAANNNQITQWVDATGVWAATATTPTVANRNLIKAVRVAVIAQNGLLERNVVSTGCSSYSAANPSGVCAWDATSANPTIASVAPVVNLNNIPDWDRYRYKAYESIVPLRNIIWNRGQL